MRNQERYQETSINNVATVIVNGIEVDVLANKNGLFVAADTLARLLGMNASRVRQYLSSATFRNTYGGSYSVPTTRLNSATYQLVPMEYAVAFLMHYTTLSGTDARAIVTRLVTEAFTLRAKCALYPESMDTEQSLSDTLKATERETEQWLKAKRLHDMRVEQQVLVNVCNMRNISSVEVVNFMLTLIVSAHAIEELYDATYGFKPDGGISVVQQQLFRHARSAFCDCPNDIYRDNWQKVAWTCVHKAEIIVIEEN